MCSIWILKLPNLDKGKQRRSKQIEIYFMLMNWKTAYGKD